MAAPEQAPDVLEGKFRIAEIVGHTAIPEPVQEGVLRYPPIRINMPLDASRNEGYINMEPTDWFQVFRKKSSGAGANDDLDHPAS